VKVKYSINIKYLCNFKNFINKQRIMVLYIYIYVLSIYLALHLKLKFTIFMIDKIFACVAKS
jgi:hypothetical protein